MPEDRLDDLTILVVDDQSDSREMLASLLEQRGARIVRSASAESALNALRDQALHLLVAAITMPRFDGYELMRRIRAAGNQMPGIAVAADARFEDRRNAFECGYTAYLAKPIDGARLTRIVRGVIPPS